MSDNGSPAIASASLQELQTRLEDPQTAQLLGDILDKLDVVQLVVASLDGVLRRADTLADNVAGSVAELRQVGDPRTMDSLATLARHLPELADGLDRIAPALGSPALDRLADPAVLQGLADLAERTPLLLFAAEAAEGFLGRAESIAENAADSMRDVRDALADKAVPLRETLGSLSGLVPGLLALLNAFKPLVQSGAIESLANSNVLAPEIVEVVGSLGDALHATKQKEQADPHSIGLLGLLKTMRDPDAQRAMGFLATFLKEFGSRLR